MRAAIRPEWARQRSRDTGTTVARPGSRKAPAAALICALVAVAAAVPALLTGNSVAQAATSGGVKIAYYDQWSIYQNAYYLKNVDTTGVAGKLDYMLYDFENIDPTNLTCFEATKATDPDPGGENDPNAGDGAEDQFADYQKTFDASTAVSGVADVYGQPIAGNFNQLKELKAKHPNLKIVLSIGGWTYSKYFSDVAKTAASRQKFVSSCIDMFIAGNIPASGGYGGPGTAAGIFDGIDIDWEYPGSSGGHLGNHVDATNDPANFTALLAEFRSELDAYGAAHGGKHYALTAALPSGQDKIKYIQTNKIGQYLDFGNIMTYDMHGGFEPTGPTNFQDPTFTSPNDPMTPVAPGTGKYSIDEAMKAWTQGAPAYGIPGGFPANKATIGFPFYYRGWTGVPAGSNHGLYQQAAGPSQGYTLSGNVPGVAMYKEITNIVANPSDTFYDPQTQAAWFYDGTTLYVGDSPQSIKAKADYLHCNGYGGAMMFSLYDLDPAATLFNDVVNDVNGSTTTCVTPTGSSKPSVSPTSSHPASPSASPTRSTSPTPSHTPSTSPTPSRSPSPTPTGGGSGAVVNGGFETGALSPWTGANCSVVASPVHAGTHALAGAVSSSDTAQCSQTIAVSPNHTYSLKGWVNGSYVYIGVTGTGTSDTSTWTPGTSGAYAQLSVGFTTGASTTSVTIWVHGWYAQGTYHADDFSVT
ncbi:MAG TPA: glycosyl hydrolase family 18 protein [Rugosimonospora sp.]